jgi:mTERF domain-containing protein
VRTNRFSEIVSDVMKLGFDPNNLLFVLAIRVMAVMSKTLWEQKVEAYKSFGLSKDEIYSAFKRLPLFMIVSEMKIKKLMAFFVNKLKMKPLLISKNPNLLLPSLEKRIIPRCSVLQLLMQRG